MNLPEITADIQRLVKADPDGDWGPETALKVYLKLGGKLPVLTELVDARSEKVFARLQPPVIPYMRALVHMAKHHDVTIVATSGLRTYAEQEELFKQGRTKPGTVVTYAHGGYSSHNFGGAVDFTLFRAGKPVWESPLYRQVGAWGKSIGLSWGGDWTGKNTDEPHFYLKPLWAKNLTESQMMAEFRRRTKAEEPIYS